MSESKWWYFGVIIRADGARVELGPFANRQAALMRMLRIRQESDQNGYVLLRWGK